MKPYIAKQTRLTKERIEAKLESSLAQKLEKYCEYLESDRDYIISQALEIAFKKDQGFTTWLASQETPIPAAVPPEEILQPATKGKRARGENGSGEPSHKPTAITRPETGSIPV